MSTVTWLAAAVACACIAAIWIARVRAHRADVAEKNRLKAHLNWITPEAPGARRRSTLR